MRKMVAYSFFFLPLLVLIGWVYRLGYTANYGNGVILKVAAYDPRDLLAGHYLQYTIDFSPDGAATTITSSAGQTSTSRPCAIESKSKERCVCLKPERELQPATVLWMGACAEELLANCPTYIRGECDGLRFESGLERYYVPERLAKELTRVPEGAKILARLDGRGGGVVTQFFVKDRPL